jgi:geranylgeranyl pyrophosphate synthase
MDIQDLVKMAQESPKGDRESVLPTETRHELDEFVKFLRAEGKTEATARSYRSYVVTALTSGDTWDEFSSDVRSALRALARFQA